MKADGKSRNSPLRSIASIRNSGDIRIVADDFDGPNGLAFSPDESRLYVAETGDQTADHPRQYIRVFDVGADGQRSPAATFFTRSSRVTATACASTRTATSGAALPTASIASIQMGSCLAKSSYRIGFRT